MNDKHSPSPPQLGSDSLDEVIAAMTAQEKVNLVIGTGASFPGLSPKLQAPVVGMTLEGRVPGAAGTTCAIPRLGIPALVTADGPAGVRINPQRDSVEGDFFCTAFPIATLLASSWDTDMLREVGSAVGKEALEYGVDVRLGPALNVHRIPLGGRNFEYYSEDPLVSGKMAGAMIEGVQSQGVATSIKHFVANDHEWNRNVIDVKVDQRALREIYLKGFEIAIKSSNPWTVMTSYNKLNGVYTSESSELLTTILRDQWGYDGCVMTDWFGGRDPVAQLRAGNDLLMPGSLYQQEDLQAAIASGELEAEVLDRDIKNILRLILKSPVFKHYKNSDKPDLKFHADVARRAAEESIILLQNNQQSLPVSKGNTLALFGNTSYEMITGGTGSGNVNRAYTISLPQGINSGDCHYDRELEVTYLQHIDEEKQRQKAPKAVFLPLTLLPERSFNDTEIEAIADRTDAALLTIGRHSGEFVDRREEDDFCLSETERQLLETVSKAFRARNKPCIVVLNVCGVIETDSWKRLADAILLVWQPGQESGLAINNVLTGVVNPSGKLATTFARHLKDHPSFDNFPGETLLAAKEGEPSLMGGDRAAEVLYEDGIWVGYRAFVSRGIASSFPFGHGLSYTRFDYNDVEITAMTNDSGVVGEVFNRPGIEHATVTITNNGKRAGREVVQLYIAAPTDQRAKAAFELRAFAKTGMIQPGQSEQLVFDIQLEDLTSFDVETDQWVVDAGEYTLMIGASCTDIRTKTTFSINESIYIGL